MYYTGPGENKHMQ